MQLPAGFTITPMREAETKVLDDWAAGEGWNPGLSDLAIAWHTEPEAFVALREGDRLAGGGTIYSYDGHFGFMGLFIMRADLRRQGLGAVLWHWRRDTLLQRLRQGAAIGMDGVFDMVPFYEKGGFKPAYRDLRYQGIAAGERCKRVITLSPSDFADIGTYDRPFFPAPRDAFLKGWLGQRGAHIAGIREDGKMVAYGVARPCRVGFKVGPLFADRADLATDLLGDLLARIAGNQVQIDVPEPNAAGLAIVKSLGLAMTFGCVRLYHGSDPSIPVDRIFGVTSLEFG
jgi:GNAT superfamily N-acetyltransferase